MLPDLVARTRRSSGHVVPVLRRLGPAHDPSANEKNFLARDGFAQTTSKKTAVRQRTRLQDTETTGEISQDLSAIQRQLDAKQSATDRAGQAMNLPTMLQHHLLYDR